MKNNRLGINKFDLYFVILLIMYFIAKVINNDTIYWLVCIFGILLLGSILNCFNSYLRKSNYSTFARIVLGILIPGIIILICYMVF